jgi:hypothetical protein
MYLCGKLPFLCKFAICDLLSVVWFAAKIYRVEFYGKKPHGKNYTNGLNIKVCLVVDSFSRNLKSQFLIIKIDMSKILIIEDEAAIRRVLPKYFLRRVIPTKLKMLKTVCRVMKKKK